MADVALDREIETLVRLLQELGATDEDELARRANTRDWGPGRFHGALRAAVQEGRASHTTRHRYEPPRAGPVSGARRA